MIKTTTVTNNEAAQKFQTEPASHTFTSQRLKLHYVEWGNKDAPTLILVHGGSDHCRNWDWVASVLCEKYHIIAPDLRGHGDSEWVNTSYRVLDFIYDLDQLINVNELNKVTIVGHSFGGWISSLYAGMRPELVEKLVVIDGLDLKTPEERASVDCSRLDSVSAWLDHLVEVTELSQRRHSSFEAMLERMQAQHSFLSLEQATHLTKHGARPHEDGTYSWKFDRQVLSLYEEVELSRADVFEVWRKITCPLLVIQGEKSNLMKPENDESFSHLKNCKLVNIPDTGHWPHHQDLPSFLKEVTAFLYA